MDHHEFQQVVWGYYHEHARDLPWRVPEADGTFSPYKILVSEIMLQQTQASRVVPKYQTFITRFPTVRVLAEAPLADVLVEWSGLGYNRRAKFLWQAARQIQADYDGVFPRSIDALVALPGVGHNTAAAVMAYAYNTPVAYVETNILTVFIHHFFRDSEGVGDKDLLPIIKEALDHEHPREWYWALMDYGAHIKSTVGNLSRYSKHYAKQPAFKGSKRQVRGAVLRQLVSGPRSQRELAKIITDERLGEVLGDLIKEALIIKSGDQFRL